MVSTDRKFVKCLQVLLIYAFLLLVSPQTDKSHPDIEVSAQPAMQALNNKTNKTDTDKPTASPYTSSDHKCPSGLECSKLGAECIDCAFNKTFEPCVYGKDINVSCKAKTSIDCTESNPFFRTFRCAYCYQTPSWQYTCRSSSSCTVRTSPRRYYTTNCTMKPDYLCLGRRNFYKRLPCNWTSGYRWSTALILSITLGGFGIDRFYLGLWREGIGKLFSFGGLGVWTIVDVVLISIGYIGPYDGSLYVY